MLETENFVRKINKAFAEVDRTLLLNSVTDDFVWEVVGEKTFSGKTEFSEALEKMEELPPMEISIKRVLVDGTLATVEGIVVGRNRIGQEKQFGFCDLYTIQNSGELKIKEITSYVVDVSKHKRYKEDRF